MENSISTMVFQQCIIPTCGKKYPVSEIRTQCDCGNLLDVVYSKKPSPKLKKIFSERRNHQGNIFDESGVWRFRELINFAGVDCENYKNYSGVFVSLDGDEGKTKPFHLSKVAKYVDVSPETFYLQFEGRNPTGSFKDNGMATGFTHAKMLGVKKVGCASTGNTAASLSAFAANEGWEAIIFIGEGKIAAGKLAQTLAYGAKVIQIKGDFDDAFEKIKQVAKETGLYLLNSINAFRLEGQKTIIYRVLDYFNWQVPDWIIWPGGNLGNSAAFGKGFSELKEWGFIKKIPRIAIINAEGANTLFTLYNKRGLRWNEGRVDDKIIEEYYFYLDKNNIKAKTRASAIEILKPANLKKALRTLEFLNSVVAEISDQEIFDAQAVVSKNGFGCEPASAATVAGIKKLREQGVIEKNETVVGILTGEILKDPQAIIDYHFNSENKFANPPIKVEDDLKTIMKLI